MLRLLVLWHVLPVYAALQVKIGGAACELSFQASVVQLRICLLKFSRLVFGADCFDFVSTSSCESHPAMWVFKLVLKLLPWSD